MADNTISTEKLRQMFSPILKSGISGIKSPPVRSPASSRPSSPILEKRATEYVSTPILNELHTHEFYCIKYIFNTTAI